MITTDKLVFLQMRKTGSTHIARLLQAHVGATAGRKHARLPDGVVETRRVIGSIRDPWSYYVSTWAFGFSGEGVYDRLTSTFYGRYVRRLRRRPWRSVQAIAAEARKPRAAWRGCYTDPDDVDAFRRWLRRLHQPARRFDPGELYGYSSLWRFAGLMTYRYVRLFCRDIAPLYAGRIRTWDALRAFDARENLLADTVRLESLADDFIAAVERAGHALSAEQRAAIREAGRSNRSRHRPVADYYDAATAALVADRERLIIEKYSYRPPWEK